MQHRGTLRLAAPQRRERKRRRIAARASLHRLREHGMRPNLEEDTVTGCHGARDGGAELHGFAKVAAPVAGSEFAPIERRRGHGGCDCPRNEACRQRNRCKLSRRPTDDGAEQRQCVLQPALCCENERLRLSRAADRFAPVGAGSAASIDTLPTVLGRPGSRPEAGRLFAPVGQDRTLAVRWKHAESAAWGEGTVRRAAMALAGYANLFHGIPSASTASPIGDPRAEPVSYTHLTLPTGDLV